MLKELELYQRTLCNKQYYCVIFSSILHKKLDSPNHKVVNLAAVPLGKPNLRETHLWDFHILYGGNLIYWSLLNRSLCRRWKVKALLASPQPYQLYEDEDYQPNYPWILNKVCICVFLFDLSLKRLRTSIVPKRGGYHSILIQW